LLEVVPLLEGHNFDAELIDELFEVLAKKGIGNRYQIKATVRTRKKVQRAMDTSQDNVEVFNGILHSERLQFGHRRPKPIYKTTPEYLTLREVAQMAEEFRGHFNFSNKRDALATYIKIGLDMMGSKYAVGKFKYYHEKITDRYDKIQVVKEDSSREDTKKVYNLYQQYLLEYNGVDFVADTVEKFFHLVNAKKEADEQEAHYEQYLKAQFEGLAYMEKVPEVYQLYGEGAVNRWESYLKDNAKIKKDSIAEFGSDEEEDYFNKIN